MTPPGPFNREKYDPCALLGNFKPTHGCLFTAREPPAHGPSADSEQVLPKSDAGEAIARTLKNRTAVTRYCSDGDLSIDNNGAERFAAELCSGRNNWTSFGSDNGGRTGAVLRSFVTSCELAGIDPFAWFRDVRGRITESRRQTD